VQIAAQTPGVAGITTEMSGEKGASAGTLRFAFNFRQGVQIRDPFRIPDHPPLEVTHHSVEIFPRRSMNSTPASLMNCFPSLTILSEYS
jgi:hypothetical protein